MKRKHIGLFCGICFIMIMVSVLALPCRAVKAESIVLSYTLHWPPPPKWGGANDQAFMVHWTKEIEKQTEGRVRFKIFYSAVSYISHV